MKKVKDPRTRQDLIDANILAPDEIRSLLDHCDARWRAIVMIAIYSGPRPNELLGLQWNDVEINTRSESRRS
jgi:integrase